MTSPLDLPAGTVYVPVLAGSTTYLPSRPILTAKVSRCRYIPAHDCPRPWLVVYREAGDVRLPRSFRTFEDARLFVVALLDGQEPTC